MFAQSFNKSDILYWLKHEPAFGKQAGYLDDADKVADLPDLERIKSYKRDGIRIVAPPLFALLDVLDGKIVPSAYAKNARQAGLGIIAWSLERSGLLASGKGDWYCQTVNLGLHHEGDMMQVLDVLGKDICIIGISSDWPATVTWGCGNCKCTVYGEC